MARTAFGGASVRRAVTLLLRRLDASDVSWLDGWLARAAATVGYDAVRADRPGASLMELVAGAEEPRARTIERDGEATGVVVFRTNAPRLGAAMIEFVATPTESSRRGSGMGAVPLIEAELRSEGVSVAYAPAPAMHGIAMYFWIRLGYRPLLKPGWPCERDGVTWLSRDL